MRRPRLDRELERYLVADETVIVAVRRHWFHLIREILVAAGATILVFWIDTQVSQSPGARLLQNASLLFWWAAGLWLLWRVLNWRRDWFVATDKRFLLFYGFIRRKVAMMPLLKVTDMTYDRSLLGRVLGYGSFVLESAGQDQALSNIDHVPDADTNYRLICTELFGPGSLMRFQPPRSDYRQDQPPDDDGRGGGGGGGSGGDRPDAGGPGPASPAAAEPPAEVPVHNPVSRPESWYRSSNLGGPSRLGDTGEIPVVRVPVVDDDDGPLYPPPHWSDRD